jgi:hypothetical protein
MNDTLRIAYRRPVLCPSCGQYAAADQIICPNCRHPLARQTPATGELPARVPITQPIEHVGSDRVTANDVIILQLLPSSSIITLLLLKPVVLGRDGNSSPDDELIDLNPYNALRHGVSRRHCRLRRDNEHLLVTDLGSTNGTYLNNRRIEPYKDTIVLHGDKIVLGTLHLIITFSPLDG